MMLPYFWRLLFFCAATFFLVNAIAGLALRLFIPAAIRVTRRMQPRAAAQFLLVLRLAPVCLATFAVLALCVPSYLSFEPGATREEVGLACVIAALLTAVLLTVSCARAIRSLISTNSYARKCLNSGIQVQTPTTSFPVNVIDGAAPVIAMVGAFRPQLIVSRGVLENLLPDELDSAIRHERAHRTSADNFKRLLLLLTPDIFPFVSRAFVALDRTWITLSEWAADDSAVADDPQRSLSLAGALVHVAQMGVAPRLSPLCTSLLSGNSNCMNQDLSVRVDRLLRAQRPSVKAPKRFRGVLTAGSVAIVCAVFVVLLRPDSLHSVHRILEVLTH
jgi:beta-lactamase regulating signal transducer with metallopeptidase domain